MARYIKKRKLSWYSNIPVPAPYRHLHGGKAKIEVSLKTRDEQVAQRAAAVMAARLQLEWAAKDGCKQSSEALRRTVYEQARQDVLAGRLRLEDEIIPTDQGDIPVDPVEAAVSAIVDEIRDGALRRTAPEDTPWATGELTQEEKARLDGLTDGLQEYQGESPLSRAEYEPAFNEAAADWLAEWRSRPERRETNTGAQYEATIRMFSGWWGNKPVRQITAPQAARYVSHLRGVDAGKARHQRTAGEHGGAGLSDATINRHVGTLKAIWHWAKQRGLAEGDNPWDGLRVRLSKRNTDPYVAWSIPELRKLLVQNPPRRRELYELSFLGLYTGLRISEAAGLTWGQVRQDEGVWYIQVEDAKTDAGNRRVPLHDNLAWLLEMPRGSADEPVWPGFNPEGPARDRGDDASRLFGAHKRKLGFTARRKAFHSFRKNITGQMEQLEVPSNVWARIIGHEPGFTFGTYNPDGLTLSKMQEIINRIDYAGLELPEPGIIYG